MTMMNDLALWPGGDALAAAVLAAGAVLVRPVGVGARLTRLRRARLDRPPGGEGAAPSADVTPPVLMELVAAALDCGLSPQRAMAAALSVSGDEAARRLGPHVDAWRLGADVARAWQGVPSEHEALARSLVLAERTGASAATVLRRVAGDERARRRRRARVGAHRLGVQLVVPLGLTTLPAFVLWSVVPVVIGLAGRFLAAPS